MMFDIKNFKKCKLKFSYTYFYDWNANKTNF